MKYIITEDQYNFLKYGDRPRLEYMEIFEKEVQEMIDDNMEFILEDNNNNGQYDKILDLIVDENIRLGIGNRAYDITVWAILNKKEEGNYYVARDTIEWKIRNLIKDKYGFKTSVKIELSL